MKHNGSTLARLLACFALFTPAAAAQAAVPDLELNDPLASTNSGFGLAIDVEGDRALVSAINAPGPFPGAGAVYVLERQLDGSWPIVATLLPSDPSTSSNFGSSIALDGDRALVGASLSDASASNAGAAYVFERQPDGSWVQAAQLLHPNPPSGAGIGISVDLDGDRAVLGASGGPNPGSAYVLERDAQGNWGFAAELQASDAETGYFFGRPVALDGDRVYASATGAEIGGVTSNFGAVYVFERSPAGTWSEIQKLVASDFAQQLAFGRTLSVDGGRMAVGATTSGALINGTGTAYLLEEQPDGTWLEVQKILNPMPGSQNGFSTALALDGDALIVCAPYEFVGDVSNAGAAYLYRRRASGLYELELPVHSELVEDFTRFGSSAAVDGGRAFLGNSSDGNSFFPVPDAAYVLELGTLFHGPIAVPFNPPGTQDLLLRAGDAHAGAAYFVLGSITGTSPGTAIPSAPGVVLPLNADGYTDLTLAGLGPIVGFFGTLDAAGQAGALVVLPPGLSFGLVGLVVHHAYVGVDPGTGAIFTSNAAPLEIVPF